MPEERGRNGRSVVWDWSLYTELSADCARSPTVRVKLCKQSCAGKHVDLASLQFES